MCEFCPYTKTLKRWNGKTKCPCKCKDGREREQEPDGTCNCKCLCEDGVTEDEVDEHGNCPCECECKNCKRSKIGADGKCYCPNDKCPVCEDGSEGVWKNCECECPEPECGIPPVCASGRRGLSCDLPNCPTCPTCKGRGICTAGRYCQASCRCNPRWTGKLCSYKLHYYKKYMFVKKTYLLKERKNRTMSPVFLFSLLSFLDNACFRIVL